MKYINDFLKKHSIEDVQAEVIGELNEYSTDLATYFFGNGELIVSPADQAQEEQTFVVDTIGFNSQLVLT